MPLHGISACIERGKQSVHKAVFRERIADGQAARTGEQTFLIAVHFFYKTGHSNVMKTKMLNRNKTYRSFDFYVLLFFLLSMFGWLWEGAIYLITSQSFVNRGVYYGPYLPIYGVGGIFLWFLLGRLSKNPVLTFFLSMLISAVLEYTVSFCLEKMWGVRWWDYSGWILNINGRICLVSVTAFGLGGMALNCFLLPYYMRLYHKLSRRWRIVLSALFLAVFILDATYCAVRPHMGDNVSYENS